MQMPKVIVTSVVRGSQQGESHGGVYIVDFENRHVNQCVDWNTGDINFSGRGADRGLRGITFDGDDIYIAASDELFCYDREFQIKNSWRNPYLKHCHEIIRKGRNIFLTSTGFDCLLAFDIDKQIFTWGLHLLKQQQWNCFTFDPRSAKGPVPVNKHHINMVHVDNSGLYMSGLNTKALLNINQHNLVQQVCNLPSGTHNVQPFKDGVIFNDSAEDCVRFVSPTGQHKVFPICQYDSEEIEFADIDDSRVARQGFGRGLCSYTERFIIGGSSPSTISIYDMENGLTIDTINLTMDIRNAIHGLEIWPYD